MTQSIRAASSLAIIVAASTLAVSAASAATCWSAKFKIINNSRHTVAIYKIYYYDKNNVPRTENVKNTTLLRGQSYTSTGALRKVGGEPFSTQISYKSQVPYHNRASWSAMKRTTPKSQGKCISKKLYRIEITR
ncbi:MAG: hypothetical protein WBV39_06140 [Rudaea sp.]